MKSGNLKFLEPSGPLQACNRTPIPLPIYIHTHTHTHKSAACSSVSPSCPVPPNRYVVKNSNYRIDLIQQRVPHTVGQSTVILSHIIPRKSTRAAVLSLRQKWKIPSVFRRLDTACLLLKLIIAWPTKMNL